MIAIHLYQSPMVGESRIERIADTLLDEGILTEVTLVGTSAPGLPARECPRRGLEILRIGSARKAGGGLLEKATRTTAWSRAVREAIAGRRFDLVNCHAVSLLPLCTGICARSGARLIYDTHELETETYYCRGPRKLLLKAIERRYIRRAAHTFVVGPRIAKWYRDTYGIEPTVIRNMPIRKDLPRDAGGGMRSRLGIAQGEMVFLYLGKIAPGRGIEKTIEIFGNAPGRHVVFMGDGPLVPLVKAAGSKHSNIHHHPPVPPSRVTSEAMAADVGIFLSARTCLSYEYSCPNKFFEYLQAGLPVMVTDNFVEQAEILLTHRAGWVVSQDAVKAGRAIASLTAGEVSTAAANARSCAVGYHWGIDRELLVQTYRRLLGR